MHKELPGRTRCRSPHVHRTLDLSPPLSPRLTNNNRGAAWLPLCLGGLVGKLERCRRTRSIGSGGCARLAIHKVHVGRHGR